MQPRTFLWQLFGLQQHWSNLIQKTKRIKKYNKFIYKLLYCNLLKVSMYYLYHQPYISHFLSIDAILISYNEFQRNILTVQLLISEELFTSVMSSTNFIYIILLLRRAWCSTFILYQPIKNFQWLQKDALVLKNRLDAHRHNL